MPKRRIITYIIGGLIVILGMALIIVLPEPLKKWGVWVIGLGALIMSLPLTFRIW